MATVGAVRELWDNPEEGLSLQNHRSPTASEDFFNTPDKGDRGSMGVEAIPRLGRLPGSLDERAQGHAAFRLLVDEFTQGHSAFGLPVDERAQGGHRLVVPAFGVDHRLVVLGHRFIVLALEIVGAPVGAPAHLADAVVDQRKAAVGGDEVQVGGDEVEVFVRRHAHLPGAGSIGILAYARHCKKEAALRQTRPGRGC